MCARSILLVRSALGQGGADRVALNLIKHLPKRGFAVRLLLMKCEGEFLEDLPPGVLIKSKNIKSLWFFYSTLRRVIKEQNPDIVFSIDGGVNVLLGIMAIFYGGASKFIVSERNVLFPPGKNPLKYFAFAIIKFISFRFVYRVTAVSEGVRQELISTLKLNPNKVYVVNNPIIDSELFEEAVKPVSHDWFSSTRDVPVITHAGRFVFQKDHMTLLHAFKRVNDVIPCRLLLLGEGPLMEECRNLVKSLGVEDRVFFGGFDKNPFKYFLRSDLFVLSSRHEGMPGVLIQAMALGLPVVSTRCRFGPEEIINAPGRNGILVSVGNVEEMAQAIINVLSSAQLSNQLRENAKFAVERFEVHNALQSYEESFL
jgi:glycosyltransferase involved in cell wall biosynthesis